MLKILTAPQPSDVTPGSSAPPQHRASGEIVVIWIDWYPYHVARFTGLVNDPSIGNAVVGIELVGGMGVHAGLKFREPLPADLPVQTLLPEGNWRDAPKLRLALDLWHRLSELNPNVVLVPGYYTLPAIAAALWARLHDRRSVLMTESTRADHVRVWWKEAAKGLLLRTLFNWAVSGGRAHREYLADLGFPGDRVGRFYDVVDNNFFAREAAAFRTRSSAPQFGLPATPYFLYVGRLASEKNVDGLLRTYLAYREQGGHWPLVLVGDGPEAALLKSTAAASAWKEDIYFPGHKGSAELPLFYAFAGYFVLPSSREPWGLVVNEAMASGLPVIVSDRCGCVPDLLRPGRTGLVFDPTSPTGLLDCLGSVSALSTEDRQRMGAAAAAHVSLYSPAAFAREVAAIAAA